MGIGWTGVSQDFRTGFWTVPNYGRDTYEILFCRALCSSRFFEPVSPSEYSRKAQVSKHNNETALNSEKPTTERCSPLDSGSTRRSRSNPGSCDQIDKSISSRKRQKSKYAECFIQIFRLRHFSLEFLAYKNYNISCSILNDSFHFIKLNCWSSTVT